MGRPRLAYSLYPRKYDGKVVWYYRTYSNDGERTSGRSTFQTSKTLAKKYCDDLVRTGKIFKGKAMYFDSFCKDMFTENSEWYKEKFRNSKPSINYLSERKYRLEKFILPVFGHKKIADIKKSDVIKFQDDLLERQLSSGFVKSLSMILGQILDYAVSQEIILSNVIRKLPPLKVTLNNRDSFTEEEAYRFIHTPTSGVVIRASIVAACTGLRLGELLAVRKEKIHDNYLAVDDQIQNGVLTTLKTKTSRIVPLCPELKQFIEDSLNSNGWMFTFNPKAFARTVKRCIQSAKIEDYEKRMLSFYSWRHFFNTYMLSHIPGSEPKVASIMGHKIGETVVRSIYTNFKIGDYQDIIEEQARLFRTLTE